MCSLRDAAADLSDLDAKILALSLDDVASQSAFAKAQGLTYPVLSDPDGSAAARYGVLAPGGKYAQRVTFVIDPEGVIRHIDREVNVDAHGTDLKKILTILRAEAAGD